MHPSNKRRILFAVVLFLLIWDLKLFASLRPETRNRLHLDRLTCTIREPKLVESARCIAKYISAGNLRIDYQAIFTGPIQNLWFHVIFYFKFNGIVYNKFPIDVWEDVCDFMAAKKSKSIFLDWLVLRLLPFTNLNHSCPYSSFIVKADNVSAEKTFSFDKAILPSGRYRVDVTFTKEDRIPFLDMKIFGTNAEHHFEKI